MRDVPLLEVMSPVPLPVQNVPLVGSIRGPVVITATHPQEKLAYGSREGQFPRWRSAVRVRSEGSAVKAPQ